MPADIEEGAKTNPSFIAGRKLLLAVRNAPNATAPAWNANGAFELKLFASRDFL